MICLYTSLSRADEMKKTNIVIIAILLVAIFICLMGCGGSPKADYSLTGVWEYSDEVNGISSVYDFKDDGTGTYTMTVGGNVVVYEMKYEVNDGHLLIIFVNNDIFTEEDVFDSEFRFKDENTLIVKDSLGDDLKYIRQ